MALLSAFWLLLALCSVGAKSSTADRPNIVLILTDDQDTHMQSLEHMPLTQKYLINEGTVFEKHYCTGIGTTLSSRPWLMGCKLQYVVQVVSTCGRGNLLITQMLRT